MATPRLGNRFLVVWLVVALGFAGLTVGLALFFLPKNFGWGSDSDFQKLDSPEFAAIEAKHNLQVCALTGSVDFNPREFRIQADRADGEEIAPYVSLLAEEFDLYPAELVQRSRIERIVLCKNLKADGEDLGGVADLWGNTFYLDVSYAVDRLYARSTIHHEFFHIIDHRDDGRIDSDAVWQSLNPRHSLIGRTSRVPARNGMWP